MLGELSIDNLRSSLGIFSALFYLPCLIFRGSKGIFPAFFHLPYSTFRGSLGIFPAFFHLPYSIFGVRRKSFLHFSIYPSRLQKFVGNLFSIFPSSLPDIRSSPEIFSASFHSHRPISKVRRESFRQLSINTSRPTKFAGILRGN